MAANPQTRFLHSSRIARIEERDAWTLARGIIIKQQRRGIEPPHIGALIPLKNKYIMVTLVRKKRKKMTESLPE